MTEASPARLCPRCERLLPLHYFTPAHRICKVCNSKAQGKRAAHCDHPHIIKDKPGLTCTTCGGRWRRSEVYVGRRTFIGYSRSEVK